MKKSILTLALVFTALLSFAQTGATTDNGERVILNTDGTWEYEKLDTSKVSEDRYSCESLITTEVDKVSGVSTVAAKEILIVSKDGGTNGVAFYPFISSSKNIIMSISAYGGSACIDDDAKMNVLFRDGSRIVLYNDAKFNCDRKFTLYFGGVFGKKKELNQLCEKEIETVRVWTSKGYVEETLDSDQSKELMSVLNCLRNN
jgi:hypothetical protein